MDAYSSMTLVVRSLALVLTATMVAPAAAQETYYRPCQPSDFPGLWEVVHWSSPLDHAQLASYAARHQWFLFGKDGSLRSITSNRPSSDVAKIREMLERLPVVMHYTCPKSGEVRTTRSDIADGDETWGAYHVQYDTWSPSGDVHLMAGDIVMELLDRSGKSIYTRQMRPLGGTPPKQLGPR